MFKNKRIILLITLICVCCVSITTYASVKILARSISFTPSDSSWNVDNVEDAINSLKTGISLSTFVDSLNAGNYDISKGLVPELSSNEGTNGNAFCSGTIYTYGTTLYDCYKAFNFDLTGNDPLNWASYVLDNNSGYVGYEFNKKQNVSMFYVNLLKTDNNTGVLMTNFKLQASNDGTNWLDLTESITQSVQSAKYYLVTKNKDSYKYYRLYGTSAGAYSLIAIHELQLYDLE